MKRKQKYYGFNEKTKQYFYLQYPSKEKDLSKPLWLREVKVVWDVVIFGIEAFIWYNQHAYKHARWQVIDKKTGHIIVFSAVRKGLIKKAKIAINNLDETHKLEKVYINVFNTIDYKTLKYKYL